MQSELVIDLVIAVHDASRPIRRAVESSIEGCGPELRVTVVSHDLPAETIAAKLDGLEGVRIVSFSDGTRSPSGPYNFGLRMATASYVMIMGSDDFLESGAMREWIDRIRTAQPDVAIVPIRQQSGSRQVNPPTRLHRTKKLDPVADRLFYRTAPIAIMRRRVVESLGLSLTPDLSVGEDMAFTARLWSANLAIEFFRAAPCYVVGEDAEGRITAASRPMTQSLAGVRETLRQAWVTRLRHRVRVSLAAKLFKVHILGEVKNRPQVSDWTDSDVDEIRQVARKLLAFAPSIVRYLDRASRRLADALTDDTSTADSIIAAHAMRSRAGRLISIVPQNPFYLLHREGVLVRYALYRFER